MNKDTERYYLLEFLKLIPELRELKPIDFEAPDFLCDVAGIKTGIEVTRFFFPSSGGLPPQAAHAYRTLLSAQLEEEHFTNTTASAQVSVIMYRNDALLQAGARSALKVELLNFVPSRIPPPGPYVAFDFESLPPSLSEKGVDTINIINAGQAPPCWSFPDSTFPPKSTSSIIQGILNQKSPLLPKYRKQADKLWLLILSGTDGLHSTVWFDADVLTHEYTTGFDRLFLFRTAGPSTHELKIS